MNAFLEHAFNPDLTLFAELLLNRNETQSIMAPTPFFGQWIPGFHPDNPWGEDLLLLGRILDSGDRGFDSESTTWRALAGLRGNWSSWDWETAVMASESEVEETIFNGISAVEFDAAVVGMGGPNGDQYYNPFGHNTQNPADVVDQMLVNDASSVATTKELTFDLQVSGNFWDLKGGPAGAAFGIQARKQELDQAVDEILSSGMLGDDAIQPLQADRDIWSVFGEIMLPLLPSLEAQLALRYDHYSDFGSTTNPKIGLGWRPLEELLIRTTWGTSFRPPTFRDLYQPPTDGFSIILEDPHRCPVTGDPLDCFGSPVLLTSQGNPDLEPDEGETLLLGAAWEPSFAPGLEISIDFWQIEHENRILYSGAQDIAFLLLEELDPFNNPFFERAPQTPEDQALGIPGVILTEHHTAINGDTLTTNGIDFAIRYSWDTLRAGLFDISLDYTWLNEFESGIDMLGVQSKEDYAGGYGEIGGLPEHRANLRLNWKLGSHGASALIAYAGEYDSWLNIHVDEVDTGETFTVDDYIQLDLQYNYVFSSLRDGMLRVGCRNCTDEDPPVYNYDVSSEAFHEGRGAMWYVRWSQPF
jgi:outer membrane receptor protein involved in Fe transport